MLTNKHVIAALIIAPILAIISYFAVDMLVAEKPHKAKAGQEYPLVAKSNCRYNSGRCTLKNGQLRIDLEPIYAADKLSGIQLQSNYALKAAKLAFVEQDSESLPENMNSIDDTGNTWSIKVFDNSQLSKGEQTLPQVRLVAWVEESLYYAETQASFLQLNKPYTR